MKKSKRQNLNTLPTDLLDTPESCLVSIKDLKTDLNFTIKSRNIFAQQLSYFQNIKMYAMINHNEILNLIEKSIHELDHEIKEMKEDLQHAIDTLNSLLIK